MIGKEAFNPFFAKVCHSVLSTPRADCWISQLESAFGTIVSIVLVTSLEIADHQLTSRGVVGEVRVSLHVSHLPVVVRISDPSSVACVLCVVSNEGLDQVRNARVALMNAAFVDHNLFSIITEAIPLVSNLDCLVDYAKVMCKVLALHGSKLRFEALARSFLAVSIATDIGSFQTYTKGSLSELVICNADICGGEIGASGRLRPSWHPWVGLEGIKMGILVPKGQQAPNEAEE